MKRGCWKFANSTAGDAITDADYGTTCYVVDNQTVAKTNGSSTRSAAGTVRAQLARVYAKAGVRSQSALIALFMEELVETADGEGDANERRRDP